METILMSMPGSLVLTAEGNWTHGGNPVTNEHIARYFHTHIRRSEEHGGWVIEVDGKCVRITVIDVPRFVFEVDIEGGTLTLSDQSERRLSEVELRNGTENALYFEFSDGAVARLRRSVCQQIHPLISECGGDIVFTAGGKTTIVRELCR